MLILLAGGPAHGYSLLGRLNELGVSADDLDVGQVYRTLRELEMGGQVESRWRTPDTGAARREYAISEVGLAALDNWAAVMQERSRLIGEFIARYERLGRATRETDQGGPA